MNYLQEYFIKNSENEIHKFMHYFEIYDRHFKKYRNTDVVILEIGVNHGGSLKMWKEYFGKDSQIIGVDINPECKQFESDQIKIFIGSQEDRKFLKELVSQNRPIDIVLDDGGHTMKQQIVSFEELYPLIKDDGVYIIEDIQTSYSETYGGGYLDPSSFIEYSKRLIDQINAWFSEDPKLRVDRITRSTDSIHFYNNMVVLEKKAINRPIDKKTGNTVVNPLKVTSSNRKKSVILFSKILRRLKNINKI